MADDNKLAITRRRAVGGLIAFGAATSALGAGTAAYFSDEESSTGNTITAGDIQLEFSNSSSPTTTVDVGPVAPESSGSGVTRLENTGSIDGNLSLEFSTPSPRNDLTEVLEVTVSIEGNVIRRGTFDTVFDGEGEWSNADIPLNGGNSKDLKFAWEVPTGAGNDIQNQEAVGDITINLNQQEEAFADLVVDQTSGQGNVSTIQEGVDDIPSGGVLLVRDGTYNEAVTVDKSDVKIASKNGPSGTELVPDALADGNKALLIDAVDNVTIDGLRVTFNGTEASNNEKFAIRGRTDSSDDGPNNLTVRNCTVNNISAGGSSPSGSVVATGIALDLSTGTDSAQASNFVVENTTIDNLTCTSSAPDDSRAKGIAVNNDVNRVNIVRNDIKNIGQDPETDKPRGITFTQDGDGEGPTDFTILDNTIQNVAGGAEQPALFVGGSNGLADHEVYNNVFYQPVDNLSGEALRLRENTWENDLDDDGVPELVTVGSGGGNLIDRPGGSNYDTTYTI